MRNVATAYLFLAGSSLSANAHPSHLHDAAGSHGYRLEIGVAVVIATFVLAAIAIARRSR